MASAGVDFGLSGPWCDSVLGRRVSGSAAACLLGVTACGVDTTDEESFWEVFAMLYDEADSPWEAAADSLDDFMLSECSDERGVRS